MFAPFLPAPQPTVEQLKRLNDHGAEYWSARDFQPLLGYSQWRRFDDAIERPGPRASNGGTERDTILSAPAK